MKSLFKCCILSVLQLLYCENIYYSLVIISYLTFTFLIIHNTSQNETLCLCHETMCMTFRVQEENTTAERLSADPAVVYFENVDWPEFPWGLNPCWYTERQGCPQGELWVWVCERQTDDCLERLTLEFAATPMWHVSHHAGSSEGQHSAMREEKTERYFYFIFKE